MINQGISVIGAVMILIAFALLQARRIESESYAYQLLNFAGGAALLFVAIVEFQIGFVLLEAAWTVLSMIGLWRLARVERESDDPAGVQ